MKVFAYLFAALVALAGAGAAQAQSSNDTYVVHGTVERVDHAANRVYVTGDNGREYVVDISQGHASGSARTPGQEVTVYGRRTGEHRIEATNITADRDYRSGSAADRDRFRPRGWEQLHGTVQDVEGHKMRLRTDDGRTVRVDLSALPDRREEMINHLRHGAVVTVIGDGDSRTDRFYARHVRFDDRDLNRRAWGHQGGPGATPVSNEGETQIHGRIDTIHKDNMRLKTDDGRTIKVNIDPVRDRVRERFKVGDMVTVVGVFTDRDANRNEMTARTVRVHGQASDPVAGEQHVRGRIDTIHKDNMRLKTDDGRIIKVDIDSLVDNIRNRFKVGDRVTVIGVFTDRDGNRNEMRARTVRVEDSPAASPATNRPRNVDDCKDRGWQNYNNPSFKNQGDCVSYVNSRK
jgi:translation initiation factor IF-1